jgi:hypothetical protein
MAIAGFVCGLVGLIFSIIPGCGFLIGLPPALLGVIFGAITLKTLERKFAMAGLILGAIGLGFNVLYGILYGIGLYVEQKEARELSRPYTRYAEWG